MINKKLTVNGRISFIDVWQENDVVSINTSKGEIAWHIKLQSSLFKILGPVAYPQKGDFSDEQHLMLAIIHSRYRLWSKIRLISIPCCIESEQKRYRGVLNLLFLNCIKSKCHRTDTP